MKIVITLEHHDLIRQVEKMLAFQGMAPAGPVEFRKKKKGEGYEIVVECEPSGEPPDTCPTCGMSLTTTRQVTQGDAEAMVRDALEDKKPRVYAVEEEAQEPVHLDPELGEMSAPPSEITSGASGADEGDTDENGEYVPSIASLKATNERLTRERERELAQRRGQTPKLMPGESTKPPKAG